MCHNKMKFAQKMKHKAEEQQVARQRNKELYDEFKNSKQFSLVVSTEGRKMRLGICYQWGTKKLWTGMVS